MYLTAKEFDWIGRICSRLSLIYKNSSIWKAYSRKWPLNRHFYIKDWVRAPIDKNLILHVHGLHQEIEKAEVQTKGSSMTLKLYKSLHYKKLAVYVILMLYFSVYVIRMPWESIFLMTNRFIVKNFEGTLVIWPRNS